MGQRVCLEEGVFGAVLVIPGTSHALFFVSEGFVFKVKGSVLVYGVILCILDQNCELLF